jgi:serine acetyltransferase
MVTFKETINHIAADYRRRLLLKYTAPSLFTQLIVWIHPHMISALMYRLSRFCIYHRMRWVSNLLVIIEHVYSKNEISPRAIIGPGLVINGSGVGIVSSVTVGANCTFMGRNSITLGGMESVDLKRDRIVIEDYCIFGTGARVIRPVKLASGTQVMPNSVVLSDEEMQGSIVAGVPAKTIQHHSINLVMQWSPLRGQCMMLAKGE